MGYSFLGAWLRVLRFLQLPARRAAHAVIDQKLHRSGVRRQQRGFAANGENRAVNAPKQSQHAAAGQVEGGAPGPFRIAIGAGLEGLTPCGVGRGGAKHSGGLDVKHIAFADRQAGGLPGTTSNHSATIGQGLSQATQRAALGGQAAL